MVIEDEARINTIIVLVICLGRKLGAAMVQTAFVSSLIIFCLLSQKIYARTISSLGTKISINAGLPSSKLGWSTIPNTKLRPHCPPGVPGSCENIFVAWSGGVMDTFRNRLVMWGGGHVDYAGNEVYALDLNSQTLSRLNNPSTPNDACSSGATYADGKPASRHTYNHLAYLPKQDAMFAWGGSNWFNGCISDDAWLFSFSNQSWSKKASTNGPVGNRYAIGVAYDPNSDLVYAYGWDQLHSYDPKTDSWTRRGGNSNLGPVMSVIDPKRKKYFFSNESGTKLHWYDISSATGNVIYNSAATSGCSGFLGSERGGMEYDSAQDRIIGWSGGDKVYILNPDTLSCTTVSYPGGPIAPSQGTYGRFRYSPNSNIFVTCNDIDKDCSILRLTSGKGNTP